MALNSARWVSSGVGEPLLEEVYVQTPEDSHLLRIGLQ